MKCKECGNKIKKGAAFCSTCGTPISLTNKINYQERMLTCENCGGQLDYKDIDNIIFCPFCGSKKLIIESDAVKIRKIDNSRLIRKDEHLAMVEKLRLENEYKAALAKQKADLKKSIERGENITSVLVTLLLLIAIVAIIILVKLNM